jgi:hypothetical protein
MKKLMGLAFICLMACMTFMLTGCTKCAGDKTEPAVDVVTTDSAEAAAVTEGFNVEHLISTDRQAMFMTYKQDYRWYETCIVLKDFLDEDCDGTVVGLSNIFQVVFEEGNGADVYVVMYAHAANKGDSVTTVHSFWIEDYDMGKEPVKMITFAEAFQKIQEVNYPKPHSKHCVLRKEVGPKDCNPQYIFGNTQAQLYVDAVTGKVSDKNPVFEGVTLAKPLGEWP